MVQSKSINAAPPAYSGARFDVEGFCIAHSEVRLCKPTRDGDYKTVRKACYKCTTTACALLINDDPKNSKKLLGFRKKPMHHRVVPNSVQVAGNNQSCISDISLSTASLLDGLRSINGGHNKRYGWSNTTARRGSSSSKPPTGKVEKCSERRGGGRALSPIRNPPRSPTREPSTPESGKKEKMSEGKRRELINLMPPLCKMNTAGSSNRLATQPSSGTGVNKRSSNKSTVTRSKSRPYDEKGYCKSHPEVRLAEKNIKTGKWTTVSGVCPQCCVSAVLAVKEKEAASSSTISKAKPKKSSTKAAKNDNLMLLVQKASYSDVSHLTQSTSTPASSHFSTPESMARPALSAKYLSSGERYFVDLPLDIINKDEQKQSKSSIRRLSETTMKHSNVERVKVITNKGRGPSHAELSSCRCSRVHPAVQKKRTK